MTFETGDIMDSNSTDRVLIVGGGPVGFGLAIELALHGIESTIVERRPDMHNVPKGQNLTQRTVEHFQRWGIDGALLDACTVPRTLWGGMTAYGTLVSGYHYDRLKREDVGQYYSAPNARLPQYCMEEVLRARAAELPQITVRLGWAAARIEQTDTGVDLEIRHEDSGERVILRGAYLVGADGSRSLVREQAGIRQQVSDHDRRMALLVFRSRAMEELMRTKFPDKGFLNVLSPELEGYWQFFGRVDMGDDATPPSWFFHAPVDAARELGPEDFRRYIQKAVGQDIDVDLVYTGFWDLRFAVAETYRVGRVFIAGDACHSHPPYGGYGVNNGLEDARNLGWKLAAVIRGWGGEGLLDSYSYERQPVFASVASDFIERSIFDDRAFLAGFSPSHDLAGFEAQWRTRAELAAEDVDRYAPHYAGSGIILGADGTTSAVGGHSFAARPGCHLAPVSTDEGVPLHRCSGSGFVLLAASEGVQADGLRQQVGANSIPVKLVAVGEADRKRMRASLVLVRPDGFVAWTDAEGGDLRDALAYATGWSVTRVD